MPRFARRKAWQGRSAGGKAGTQKPRIAPLPYPYALRMPHGAAMRSRTLRAASGGCTGSSPVPSLTAPLCVAFGNASGRRASPSPRSARFRLACGASNKGLGEEEEVERTAELVGKAYDNRNHMIEGDHVVSSSRPMTLPHLLRVMAMILSTITCEGTFRPFVSLGSIGAGRLARRLACSSKARQAHCHPS